MENRDFDDQHVKGSERLSLSRRQLLIGAGATAAWAAFAPRRGAAAAPPTAKLGDTRVISHQADLYHGWPTIIRRRNGELLLTYSGGRERHVCPFGRLEMMRSRDEGKTWGWPRVLLDSEIDLRDGGILETESGTLLATTFTSLAYAESFPEAKKDSSKKTVERLQRWRAKHYQLSDEQRKKLLGVWMIRSTDGGLTWSAPYDCLVHSHHGPSQLSDGRLLYAGRDLWRGRRVGVCESADDGLTWRWLADIPARPGEDIRNNGEIHLVEAADGRIIAQIRNNNQPNRGETLQTESTDGGKSWTVPRSIGVWGVPSHLLRLKDDRLLMTYGHRRKPFGNQARLSEDNGRTWSEPIIISGDGYGFDLGYPSTVQLSDGSLLTVWYEKMYKGNPRAVLRQARWTLA